MTNDMTEMLDKYSKQLGWGLGGHQEECLTLLDMAVDELVERRKLDWQLIETAPKDRRIDIWLKEGVRWCDCYYDQICGEWRTSRPGGKLIAVKEAQATHWREPPASPSGF